jgi:hypothetical protein
MYSINALCILKANKNMKDKTSLLFFWEGESLQPSHLLPAYGMSCGKPTTP